MIPELPEFDGISWHLAPGVSADFAGRLQGCAQGLCTRVKENRRRSVYRCVLADGEVVFLKHDYPRHPRDLVKNLWRLKGRREFDASCRLYAAGIPTPRPLAWGKRWFDTFFISRELPAVLDFGVAWKIVEASPARRRQFISALGDFLGQIVEANIYHPDMHFGNLAVHLDENGASFQLLDTYGVRFVNRLASRALCMTYWLNGWARRFTPDEREALLRPLAMANGQSDTEEVWRRLMAGARRAAMKRWPKLRRRLLGEEDTMTARTDDEGKWLTAATGFSPESASRAVTLHRQNVAAGQWIKSDLKRRLSRIVCEGRKLVVKEYLKPGPLARWRSDRRAWLGALRLWRNGFEVPKPLAWLRSHSGIGYVVFEDAGPDNLPNVLRQAASGTRRRLLAEAGCLLAGLHNFGACHGDAKTTNFVVSDDSASTATLTMVDCDTVSFSTTLRESRMHAEVECFRQTIPADVGPQEAAAFADAYQAMRIKA